MIVLIVWILYLSLGFLWIVNLVKNNVINEYNLIGSLMIVLIWPFDLGSRVIRIAMNYFKNKL